MSLKDKNLALFLTDGMSLETWKRIGMLDREIELYKNLASFFNRIYIITYGNKEELDYQSRLTDNIKILYKNINCPNFVYQFFIPFRFNNFLKNCDLLKTNQLYGSIPAIISKLLHPQNKLIIRCGYVASRSAKFHKKKFSLRIYTYILEYIAYRLSNKAFITTEENANYLIKKYRFLKKKLEILNNSIRTEIFKPLIVEKKYDIGYVGRLDRDKNLLNLLKAAKDLGLKLCFIGQGKEKGNLLNFAEENNIDLTVINRVDNYELPKYYNQFRIFVFPSLHEGNPKTLLEAMSCGIPVIGCNVIGVKNIIKRGFNGLLSETDAKSLKEKMKLLLDKETLREKFSANEREYIENHYAFNILLKKELDIYEKIN